MRSVRVLVLAAIGGVGLAVAAACGSSSNSSNTPDAGNSSSSGGSSSGGSSSSSSSGGSSSSSGAGDDSGGDDSGGGDDGGPQLGNCPGSCPTAGTNCCLLATEAGVVGACLTPAACSQMNGGFVMCGSTPDTADCTGDAGTSCCLALSDAGGLPGSYCATTCPSTSYACNVDQNSCPNNGTGWLCSMIPGSTVPIDALGQCTPYDGGGTGEGGTGEGGTTDAATDAPVDTGVVDAGGQ